MSVVARWLERQAARPWSAQLLPAAAAAVALVVGAARVDSDRGGGIALLAVGVLDLLVIGVIASLKLRRPAP